MNGDARAALTLLITEARRQQDHVDWAERLLREAGVSPEDVHYFVETLNAAGAAVAKGLLNDPAQPRCSFCLKTNADVRAMITSPNANICDECSEVVRSTLEQRDGGGGLLAKLGFGRKRARA